MVKKKDFRKRFSQEERESFYFFYFIFPSNQVENVSGDFWEKYSVFFVKILVQIFSVHKAVDIFAIRKAVSES
jgi:hypothetical protein